MATERAIAATSNAVRLVLDNAAVASSWSQTSVELYQADQLQNPLVGNGPVLSIYLYRVLLSTVRIDRGPRIGADGKTYQPSLPLDLHFLVAAWAKSAATSHELLGWAFSVLQNTPVIPASALNAYRADVFAESETVELCWNPLSQADLSDVWQVASVHQAPAGTYVARSVRLDSTVELHDGLPVQVRQVDYAAALS